MPDISALLKARQAWGQFKQNHPKFAPFIDAVKNRGIPEDAILEFEIKYPDNGGSMKTNLRVTESDLELLRMLKGLM